MKKYLTMLFLYASLYFPLIYADAGGQYNGNVVNNTAQTLIVTISGGYGTFYGPNPENGQYVVGPYSSAGYSLTSSGGDIDATINAGKCQFNLTYHNVAPNKGYSSYPQGSNCQILIINSCTSCLNLIVNP